MTREDLIEFERDIAERFNAGEIKAPVHFAGGNEDQLIEIFKTIRHEDWVLCSWRSHYHCLLKGVPLEMVRGDIVRGRSIALCYPQYRVLSSAIVGGIAPIATGLAWAIKESGATNTVHVFIGDMTAETGIVHEAMKYGYRHKLPIEWIIENNGKSVCTDTLEAWGRRAHIKALDGVATEYHHDLTYPHVGTGQWVAF